MFGLMLNHSCRLHEDAREHYRLHHCGTCKAVGQQFSQRSRLFLNFDCVFLAEMLSELSAENTREWPESYHSLHCFAKEEGGETTPLPLRYAASTNVLLAALKIDDNLRDRPSLFWRMFQRVFHRDFEKAERDMEAFGLDMDAIWDWVEEQQRREKHPGKRTLTYFAEPTARITAAVFEQGAQLVGADRKPLYDFGYQLGELIYILDALEDVEKDRKKEQFNALQAAFVELNEEVRKKVADQLLTLSKQVQETIRRLPLPQTTQDEYCHRLSANLSVRVANALEGKKPRLERWKQKSLARWELRYQNAKAFARQLTEGKHPLIGAPQYAFTWLAVFVSPRLPEEIANSGNGLHTTVSFTAVMVGLFTFLALRRRIKRVFPAFRKEWRRLRKNLRKGKPGEGDAGSTLLSVCLVLLIVCTICTICLAVQCSNEAEGCCDGCGEECSQACCDACCEAFCGN